MIFARVLTTEEAVQLDCSILEAEAAMDVLREKLYSSDDPRALRRCGELMLDKINKSLSTMKETLALKP